MSVWTHSTWDLHDFVALFLILPIYGALGAAMLFIKAATFAELRESVGLGHSMALMAALFAGVLIAGFAAKFIGGW